MNDPFGANETAPWGGSGQDVGTCQANLEVGNPLTGNDVAPVSANGFTYSLQELAFFSWFFGAPSVVGTALVEAYGRDFSGRIVDERVPTTD